MTALDLLDNVFPQGVSIPVDLAAISNYLGIEVDRNLPPPDFHNILGSASRLPNGQAKIWINPLQNQYYPRERFTLAHEIGHVYLHLGTGGHFNDTAETLNRSAYWDQQEGEANRFAAELLMPYQQIYNIGRNIIENFQSEMNNSISIRELIIQMSQNFQVSPIAMGWRLYNLKLINTPPNEVL